MNMTRLRLVPALALASLLYVSTGLPATDQAAPAPAQPAAGKRGKQAVEKIKTIADELDLTKEQKASLRPILMADAEKLKALKADQTLSRQDRRAKLKEIQDELAPKLKEVLTPAQYEKWQKLREDRLQQQRDAKLDKKAQKTR